MSTGTKTDQVKVYASRKKNADVICPSCNKGSLVALPDTGIPRNLEIKCICGITIPLIFERRGFIRRAVLLTGNCFSKNDPSGGTKIKILNLSTTGMQFIKDTGEQLEPDETIRLRFQAKTPTNIVRCMALVKTVNGANIGVKFVNLDLKTQKLIASCIRC